MNIENKNKNPEVSSGSKSASLAYIPLVEASQLCPYSQEYLSLLARKGKIKAEKIDGVWYTTPEAIKDYVARQAELSEKEYVKKQEGLRKTLPEAEYPYAPRAPQAPERSEAPKEEDRGISEFLRDPKKMMVLMIVSIVVLFLLVGGPGFGRVSKVFLGINHYFKDANTLQDHQPGTHANEVLLLDDAGRISITGHIETEGQIRSWVKEGVAPIVVDSTTKVENLNVDYLDGLSGEEITLAFVTKNGNITYEDVHLQGEVEVGKILLVHGATKLLDSLLVYGELGVLGDSDLAGNVKVGKDLSVSGETELQGETTIEDNLSVSGDTAITGDTTISGEATVEGDASLEKDLTVGENLTIGKTLLVPDLEVSGDADIGGDLSVDDETTLSGSTVINSALAVNGPAIFGNTLTAGETYLGETSTGNLTTEKITTNNSDINAGSGTITGGTLTDGTLSISQGAITGGVTAEFSTSVTSPAYTGDGEVTLSSGGAEDLILDSASGTISFSDDNLSSINILTATTLQGDLDWLYVQNQPNIVSSVDGVINDEGDIDLVGGTNISIVPDDAADTITINSTVVVPAETDPIWTVAEPNYANLGQNEIIAGNWDNTANPWADNEVADDLTISGGTINNTPIGAGIPFTGAFTTLSANNGLTVSAGGASITGGLNNNLGGITNAGAISGVTDITATGAISLGDGDDNITLNAGAGALDVGIVDAGTWQGTAVDATHGGTNQTTWATGDLLYASGINILAKRTIGAANQALIVSGGVPTWGAISGGVITPDSLDYTEFKDAMALDATTTVDFGAFNYVFNLNNTGDFLIQDDGVAFASFLDDGSIILGNGGDIQINSNDWDINSAGAASGFASFSASGNVSGSTLTSTVAIGTPPLTVTSTDKVNNLNVDRIDDLDSSSFLRSDASDIFEVGNTLTINGVLTANGAVTLGDGDDNITLNAGVGTLNVNVVDAGTWQGTAVDATHGGTNQTTWATGDLLYASGVNTLAKRTIGAADNVLKVSGGVPVWGTIPGGGITPDSLDYTEFKDAMALDATTTVAFGTFNYVFNLNNTGDFLIQDDGVAFASFLDDGSIILGNGGDISINSNDWDISSAGAISGVTDITATGAISLGDGNDNITLNAGTGTLNVNVVDQGTWQGNKVSEAYGGTDQSTYATGDLLYASGVNTLAKRTIGAANQALIVSGGVPTWGAISGGVITPDSLDYTEFKDAMALDATTTVAFGAFNYVFNLNSTGDFDVQDNGTSAFFVRDDGNVGIGTTAPGEQLSLKYSTGTDQGQIYMDSGDDFHLRNNQQNNEIVIYDGTGGLGFFYNGAEVAEIDSTGGMEIKTGNLGVEGNIYDISQTTLTVNDDLAVSGGNLYIGNDAEWRDNGTNIIYTPDSLDVDGRTYSDGLTNDGTLDQNGTADFSTTVDIHGTLDMNNGGITDINWGASDDGSGSGLDADLLDNISSGSFLRSDVNDTLTATMKVTGSIIWEHNSAVGYIAFPKGAALNGGSSETGAIRINMPTSGTADMIRFTVDVFDYTTNESFTANIAGYLYQGAGLNEWVNESATIIADNTNRDFNIRFGHEGTNCIYIGETDSTWSYPQVVVRDFFGGYSTDIDAYDDGWSIAIDTTFSNVDATQSSNFPISRYAQDSDLLDGISSGSFLRSDADDTGSGAYTWSKDATDVFNFSANSTNDNRGIAFNARTALSADYNDGYLRLNNASEFTNGVYTPGNFWANGNITAGGYLDTNSGGAFGFGAVYFDYHTLNSNSDGWLYVYDQTAAGYGGRGVAAAHFYAGDGAIYVNSTIYDSNSDLTLDDNVIVNGAIYTPATQAWSGNPGASYGKIQYHSNRWYIVSDSASNRIVQFRRDGSDKSYIDNNGKFIGQADTLDGVDSSQFIRSDVNDTFTGQLTMGTQKALIASNYGHGVYGVYSSSRYQHVWSMGTAYNLPASGSDTSGPAGNLYGIAWSYPHANNPQAKAGLSHQALFMINGTTQTAIGAGIWTTGDLTVSGGDIFGKNGEWIDIGEAQADSVSISNHLIIGANDYIDDDTTIGGNADDWIHLNGYIEMKSNTDSYGFLIRDKDTTNYLGLTQVGGYSYLTDTAAYSSYFLRGNGSAVHIRGALTLGGTMSGDYITDNTIDATELEADSVRTSELKTSTGSWSATLVDMAHAAVVMSEYSFFPGIGRSNGSGWCPLVTAYASSAPAYGRWQLHNNCNLTRTFYVRWRYVTASGPAQVWIIVDENGYINQIWAAGDPVDRENPYAIVPIELSPMPANYKKVFVANLADLPGLNEEKIEQGYLEDWEAVKIMASYKIDLSSNPLRPEELGADIEYKNLTPLADEEKAQLEAEIAAQEAEAEQNALVSNQDLAEISFALASEGLEAGDLVSLAGPDDITGINMVKKSSKAYQKELVGVVSSSPGMLLGEQLMDIETDKEKFPVALTGRVLTKVSTENGSIELGDYLTSSSQPGVAMKATQAGPIIGQALELFSSSEAGTIMVNINIGSYAGPNLNKLVITDDGSVGIGMTASSTPSNILTINQGSGSAIADGWNVYSSEKYKKDIRFFGDDDYEDILEKIGRTSVANYRYKDEKDTDKLRLGLIAEFAPEDVFSQDGSSISLYDLSSFNLAGIKALQMRIEEMESKLNELGELVLGGNQDGILSQEDLIDITTGDPNLLPNTNGDAETSGGSIFENMMTLNSYGDIVFSSGIVVTNPSYLGKLTMMGNINLNGHEITNIGGLAGKDNKWMIDENGNFITSGLIAQVVDTSEGQKTMYAMGSPQPEYTISGHGQLSGGGALIEFESWFSDIISSDVELKVVVTPTDVCNGLYITSKAPLGFIVREQADGTSNAQFDWIAIARQKGYESIESVWNVDGGDWHIIDQMANDQMTGDEEMSNDQNPNDQDEESGDGEEVAGDSDQVSDDPVESPEGDNGASSDETTDSNDQSQDDTETADGTDSTTDDTDSTTDEQEDSDEEETQEETSESDTETQETEEGAGDEDTAGSQSSEDEQTN